MNFTLSQVKKLIADQKLILSHNGKQWELSFEQESEYKFSALGAGTGKHVFRIQHVTASLDWVLCFPTFPDKRDAERDLRKEMDILQRLGQAGVAVPVPFRDGAAGQADLIRFELSNMDSGFEGHTFGFFLQYLDLKERYVEMAKKGANKHARGDWLQRMIDTHKPDSLQNISVTKTSFHKILNAWTAEVWGDFQVVYDRKTGELMVIDPNDETKAASDTTSILEQWEKYLGQ
ncbi:hypothetical protein CDD83_5151 [Cordyceps sp. RAO-2017]|nr:hypothetical protein CDD83_5151 [Cordyceps sp. RAO-2017]